jgi:carbohydrate-selective porin OprB
MAKGQRLLALSVGLLAAFLVQGVLTGPQAAEKEQGEELSYDVAVTPWLHITPDLQIIALHRGRLEDGKCAGP